MNKCYVRITSRQSRNSGFAPVTELFYVDLVNEHGQSARSVSVSCHAGQMTEYGESEGRARQRAEAIASFFNIPIRFFKEEVVRSTKLKEVTPIA